MPSFRSVAPRVFLDKIPFLAFSRNCGNHFPNFLDNVLSWVKTYHLPSFRKKPQTVLARMMVQTDKQTDDISLYIYIYIYIYTCVYIYIYISDMGGIWNKCISNMYFKYGLQICTSNTEYVFCIYLNTHKKKKKSVFCIYICILCLMYFVF